MKGRRERYLSLSLPGEDSKRAAVYNPEDHPQSLAMPPPWFQASSLQDCEKSCICCLSGQPSWLRHLQISIWALVPASQPSLLWAGGLAGDELVRQMK